MVLRRRQNNPQNKPADSADADTSRNEIDIQRLESRVDALDSRLDNIDSMVTAVAERVMSRPLVINITCPHCNKGIEIALIGTEKRTS